MGDDDELGSIGEAPQELDEPPDVGVVERCLDFVEEIERARPGEEEREQERDRAERLLAAREQRQPRDALARRPQLDLDARLSYVAVSVRLRLGQPQSPLAAREECRRNLGKVRLYGGEGLGEAPFHRLGQLTAERLQLGEAALEISTLLSELLELLLLARVLLLREGVDASEGLPAALEPLESRLELLFRSLGRLRPGVREPTPGLGDIRLETGQLDLDRSTPLSGLRGLAAQLGLGAAEATELGSQLGCAFRARLGVGRERALKPLRRRAACRKRHAEPLGDRDEPSIGLSSSRLGSSGLRGELPGLAAQPARLGL